MYKSNQKKEPMSAKAKRYWAIGIVLGVLAAALLIWDSGVFSKEETAATVGDKTFTSTELEYYYRTQESNMRRQMQFYQQLGMQGGYDSSLPASDQMYDEANGITYADYFLDEALKQLQHDTILVQQAKEEGYTLSDEGKAMVEENLDALHMYSTQSGYSESAYLKLLYGEDITKKQFVELLTNSVLADEYAAEKQNSFTYTDEELDAYYEENSASLDSYEYRYCYLNSEVQSSVDENGEQVEPSEEEQAAGMDAAKSKADQMIAQIEQGTAFNEAAQQYLDETSAASYNDPEYNHISGTTGSGLSSTFSEWMMEDGRQPGDITSIEVPNVGYCVVQFLSRVKDETTYQTVTYRDILLLSDTTETEVPVEAAESEVSSDAAVEPEETETETVSLPTEEQLAAAKDQADALISEWQNGDATPESFGALAQANSQDDSSKSSGGLHENANRDTLSTALSDWLFDSSRQPGDVTTVDYTDAEGNVIGYRIVYFEEAGQVKWAYEATNALRTAAYDAWYSVAEEANPAELTEVGKALVG